MASAADDKGADGPGPSAKAVTTEQVLRREYELIWPDAPKPATLDEYYRQVQENGQAALCLSGGGIRSAAFALGVLQALSRKGLLTRFHYLSTVSGGGYIGSWLQRWLHGEARVQPAPGSGPSALAVAETVMGELARDREPREIKRLRENSNFITPRVGIQSHDTWTAVAISVRNILVNWLLFLPLLLSVVLIPNLFLQGVRSVPHEAGFDPVFMTVLLAGSALAIAVATCTTVRLLPSYRDQLGIHPGEADRYHSNRIVLPLIVWAVLGTLALSMDLFDQPTKVRKLPVFGGLEWFDGLDLAIWSFGGMIAGLLAGALFLGGRYRAALIRDFMVWPSAILVTAIWVALGTALLNRLGYGTDPRGPSGIYLTALAPLWLMSASLLGAAVFAAFRKAKGGTVKPDGDREWLARLSAVKIRPMLLWAILAPSVLLFNELAGNYLNGSQISASGIITLVAGSGAIAGGRSERSGGQQSGVTGVLIRYLPMSWIVALATFVFVVCLFFLVGRLEANLADLIVEPIGRWLEGIVAPEWLDRTVVAHLAILVFLLGLLWFFGRHIQVNRFSLNGLYRNRLARAFLGAARPNRCPDEFTGFDSADNIRMHLLRPDQGPVVLYPIVNTALNVTATQNLAWQERKAEPFIISPLYCGSGMLDLERTEAGLRAGAYVDSVVYGGSEPDLALGDTTGITLATAMSISGAAASPNMGYHSSPATAFLMTLFNVRLGAWLPNPGRADTLKRDGLNRSSPDNSLRALLRELAGSTDDRGLDIYLSDGGHFENLGLYEMIRRRCRYIVVSDAGADPDCAFADLGAAIRKVKIDFDVAIEFPFMRISSRKKPLQPDPQFAWAIGTIDYPEDGLEGTILYIKPSFFGRDLPVDVVSYAAESDSFPHETTGDQFFSESQFESYRRLGQHFVDNIGRRAKGSDLRGFFRAAAAQRAKLDKARRSA